LPFTRKKIGFDLLIARRLCKDLVLPIKKTRCMIVKFLNGSSKKEVGDLINFIKLGVFFLNFDSLIIVFILLIACLNVLNCMLLDKKKESCSFTLHV